MKILQFIYSNIIYKRIKIENKIQKYKNKKI